MEVADSCPMRVLLTCLALTGLSACFETDGVLIEAPDAAVEDGPRMCVCGDLMAQGEVHVSGGLAVEGTLGATRGLLVDGRFTSGAPRLGTNAHITVDSLVHRGDVAHGAALVTTGDAIVDGDLAVDGDLIVGGTLRQPDGAAVEVTGQTLVATRSFEVPAFEWPCDCAQRVADIADTPDDRARLGLNADGLSNLQTDLALTMPTGRYVFDGLGGPGRLSIDVDGAVELAIRGRAQIDGGFEVNVPATSRFTLVVEGDLIVSSETRVDTVDGPHAATIQVGGRTVSVSAPFVVEGDLFAPRARLELSVPFNLWGSIQVGGVSSADDLRVQ